MANRAGRWWIGLLLPGLLLILWESAVRAGAVPANLLPAPSTLAGTVLELLRSGEFWQHVAASSARVLAGFVIGALLGAIAGSAVGLSRRLEALLDPSFQGLRAIPSLAWVPLLLLWLGIDEAPKITLVALGAFFPVYLNVHAGLQGVDRKWVEVGQVHGLRGFALLWRIFLPAALPQLLTGLRSGLSLAWMFVVAAELIAATRGVGYLLTDGRETGRADLVMVAILVLALLGKLSDGVLQALEWRLLRWRDSHRVADDGAPA